MARLHHVSHGPPPSSSIAASMCARRAKPARSGVRPALGHQLTQNLPGLDTVITAASSRVSSDRSKDHWTRISGVNAMGNGMASEASWQSSGAPGGGAFTTDQPMDQRTVESLLRRLVERVEDSERRYGEALDQLHARLDQLSQTTEAARAVSYTHLRAHETRHDLVCRL